MVSIPIGKYYIAFVAYRNKNSKFKNAYIHIDDIHVTNKGCVGKVIY